MRRLIVTLARLACDRFDGMWMNESPRSVVAVVEELLARDLVVLDRVEGDFLECEALAGGFAGDIQGEIDGELAVGIGAAAVERAAHRFAVEGVDFGPVLGFRDNRSLAGGLLAVAFDGNDCLRVHRLHHVEVLALAAQFNKLAGDVFEAHDGLHAKGTVHCAYRIKYIRAPCGCHSAKLIEPGF